MDNTVCIHLNDVKMVFSKTVKFPGDISTVVGINDFWFLSLMASQSAVIFIFNSMSRLKINCAGEACSVVWCVLRIAQATDASISLHWVYLIKGMFLQFFCT